MTSPARRPPCLTLLALLGAIPIPIALSGNPGIDQANRTQATADIARAGKLGPRIGYKIAFASTAAQRQFGASEPARASLFALQRVPAGTVLPAGIFQQGLFEAEVAFTIARTVNEPPASLEDLRNSVASVHIALEMANVPPPSPDRPGPSLASLIATGIGAHRFALGPARDPAVIDVNGLQLVLQRDGETVRSSPAQEVHGGPWNALLWLVNDVLARGGELQPGDIVLTGTAASAWRADGDLLAGVYRSEAEGLGSVVVAIE